MKRVKLLALTTALLVILCSCGKDSGRNIDKRAQDIRIKFLESVDFSTTVELTADYGEKVYEYTLKYSGGADSATIEVLKPDSIAGLTATISEGVVTLTYDGAELDTGEILPGGLSPIDAVPLMISEWQSGYIDECVQETLDGVSTLVMDIRTDDDISLKTWFDKETFLPLRAEFSTGGRMVLVCIFSDTIIN